MSKQTMATEQSGANPHNALLRARRLLQQCDWLTPAVEVAAKGGKDFGRKIEAALLEIAQTQGITRIQLRNRDAAMVISMEHYEEILQLKAMQAELLERLQAYDVNAAAGEFDALYQRIVGTSREAADSLFGASEESLRQSYQAGQTETQ